MRLLRVGTVLVALLAAPAIVPGWAPRAWANVEQPQPPKEFVPVDEVPPGEQIPAINLVAAAYGFVWLVMLGYVWSIARRLSTVETELASLETRKR